MIDILETVYRGSKKGKGLVVSPKDYSIKYKYWLTKIDVSINFDKYLLENRDGWYFFY